MPLSMSEKQSVSNIMYEEYRKASKKQKHAILDQFIKLTGYNRNYASRKLRLGKKSAMKSRHNIIHSKKHAKKAAQISMGRIFCRFFTKYGPVWTMSVVNACTPE